MVRAESAAFCAWQVTRRQNNCCTRREGAHFVGCLTLLVSSPNQVIVVAVDGALDMLPLELCELILQCCEIGDVVVGAKGALIRDQDVGKRRELRLHFTSDRQWSFTQRPRCQKQRRCECGPFTQALEFPI